MFRKVAPSQTLKQSNDAGGGGGGGGVLEKYEDNKRY